MENTPSLAMFMNEYLYRKPNYRRIFHCIPLVVEASIIMSPASC